MLTDIIHAPLGELLEETDKVRSSQFGYEIDLCAIVNIKSGRCRMNCQFCAQSQHHHTAIETYPLAQTGELENETRRLWNKNIRHVGWVSSGHSPSTEELDKIIESATALLGAGTETNHETSQMSNQICCASLGQLDATAMNRLKDVGFGRYHHNLETSERFYPAICTTQRWQDRRATIERAKKLGWNVCSGGLFGIGETWEDRLQLALTLKELEVDSVPINFLNPIVGTPLADRKMLLPDEALRIIALFRLTLPTATIRICGGRPGVFTQSEQEELLFRAGANALMTGNYLTTSGISPEKDQAMIERTGFTISKSAGSK